MDDRRRFRPAAALLAGGFVTYVVVTLLHTAGPANDHEVIFDDYAGSRSWGVVHLGQFAGMAVLVAGLLALAAALHPAGGSRAAGAPLVARLGAGFAAVALGLYGVLQAVDGVALKQAIDAWVSAPATDKGARFASAETVRWLEWGARSYHSLTLGLGLILLGVAVACTAQLPRGLGLLMGLSGLAHLAQGLAVGSGGFSEANTDAILAGYVLVLAWTSWLAVLAWLPSGPSGHGDDVRRGRAEETSRVR